MKIKGKRNLSLAHTEKHAGLETVYIFGGGENGGYVITPADDNFPAVLGYSDSGTFTMTNAAPAFVWWLGEYSKEIAWAIDHALPPQSTIACDAVLEPTNVPQKESRQNIAPLVSSIWNQDSPFNNDCPVFSGNRSVTGCVATAMAQVMYKHEYPQTGTGSNSYTHNGQTISYDFSTANFDWSHMIDSYNYNAGTQTQRSAVANLMYACGVSVFMQYSPRESGAFGLDIAPALKKYFQYDNGVRYLMRDYFTYSDWENIIYTDLQEGLPVIFGGQANNGGHEFICDGYQDGEYHFNWGWGGAYDGYFLLTALNPDGEGIGGYEGGYNSDQSIICRIQKPVAGSKPWYPIYAQGGLEYLSYSNDYLYVAFHNNRGIFNYSRDGVTVGIGYGIEKEDGTFINPQTTMPLSFSGCDAEGSLSGYGGFSLPAPANPGPGTYKVYLTFRTPEGEYQNVLCPAAENSYLKMVVDDEGNVTFTEGDNQEKATIWVTSLEADGKVTSGDQATYTISIKNTGLSPYSGLLTINIFSDEDDTLMGQLTLEIPEAIAPGTTVTYRFSTALELPDGRYNMICTDRYGDTVSPEYPLLIGDLYPTEIHIDLNQVNLYVGDHITLRAIVYPDDATNKETTWTTTDAQVATVNLGTIRAIAPGTADIIATTANGVADTCHVTVKELIIDPTDISLDITNETLVVGDSLLITATVLPANATDKTVTWASSNDSTATVVDGKVKALTPGEAIISATTANGLTAICEIMVIEEEIPILATSITLNHTEFTGIPGDTLHLAATILPEDVTDRTIAWTSSDEAVATVDSEGLVEIVAEGECIIIATTTDGSDLRAECTVSSKTSSIESIIGMLGSDTDIYSLNGILIKRGADREYIRHLAPGLYIIRIDGIAYKVTK